jgi:hypothetical protein
MTGTTETIFMSKRSRVLLWLGAFVLLSFSYLWCFGVQTFFALQTRKIARKAPVARNVPIELSDVSISPAPGKKLSYLGYEFDVPWKDLDDEKSKVIGNAAVIVFRSGNAILLFVVPPQDFIKSTEKQFPGYTDVFKGMFGENVLRSDYAFKRAIYECTPRKITLLTSRQDTVGLSMILLMKSGITPMVDSEIYTIRSKDFQGFQLGNPLRRPRKMAVELYSDEVELEFNFNQKDSGPVPAITQAEINRIIQTAHKMSP